MEKSNGFDDRIKRFDGSLKHLMDEFAVRLPKPGARKAQA